MLLLIALGNAHLFLYQHRPVGLHAYPIPESTAERLAVLIPVTFFDGRELPFAFLFGYGAVQLSRRHTREGADQHTVRSLIRRRGWCMILIGFVHAMLLFGGDIIGAYGLVAVVLAGVLVRTSDRKLLIAAGLGRCRSVPSPRCRTRPDPTARSTTCRLCGHWRRRAGSAGPGTGSPIG